MIQEPGSAVNSLPLIARGIKIEEYLEAMQSAESFGLNNLDPKSLETRDFFTRHLRESR